MSEKNSKQREEPSRPSALLNNLDAMDDPAKCRYCNNHPCVLEEVDPVLEGLVQAYTWSMSWKGHSQEDYSKMCPEENSCPCPGQDIQGVQRCF